MAYDVGMASFTLSMPDDMREFVDRKTREGGFATPTEYLRSLIREDQKRDEQSTVGALLEKWLLHGSLTPEEERRLPAGALERARERLKDMLLEAAAGPFVEFSQSDWESIRAKGRDILAQRSRRSA